MPPLNTILDTLCMASRGRLLSSILYMCSVERWATHGVQTPRVFGFSSPAERAYEISQSGPASRPEERENSIFVAALKEHMKTGTLNTRVDHLLSEAAEGTVYTHTGLPSAAGVVLGK